MKTINYSIEILSYWHTGSGLYGGVDANLAVIKDEQGLPFIPGKTIKGLLREAAVYLSALPAGIPDNFVSDVFGEEQLERAEVISSSCFFTNAELSSYLKEQLSLAKNETASIDPARLEKKKAMLFSTLASTAIDHKGQALDQSLRQMEVTVPLTLYGTIAGFPVDDTYEAALKKCLAWIKRLGMNRSRGLGRCVFTLQPQ